MYSRYVSGFTLTIFYHLLRRKICFAHHFVVLLTTNLANNSIIDKKILPLGVGGLSGPYWTRTSDPIDVNDVLYRLSHATIVVSETHIYYI